MTDRHQIQARRARFDWSDASVHVFSDDPFTSHVFNCVHILLPEVERWFCRACRKALPTLHDRVLARELRAFMHQEALHANAHRTARAHLEKHGFEVQTIADNFASFFDNVFGEEPRAPRWLARHLAASWLRFRLGIVAAMEHYTCVLSCWLLFTRGLQGAAVDPTAVAILRWHAAEEIEHRAVAFDVYRDLGGTRLMRALHIALASGVLMFYWVRATRHLLRQDAAAAGDRRIGSFGIMVRMWQASAAGRLCGRLTLIRATFRYLRRDYHPEHEARLEPALRYLASAPGVSVAIGDDAQP